MDLVSGYILWIDRQLHGLVYDYTPWWFSVASVCFAFNAFLLQAVIPSIFAYIVESYHIDYPEISSVVLFGWGAMGPLTMMLLLYGMVTFPLSLRGE